MTSSSATFATLRLLARAYGIETAFYDVFHRRRSASPEALLRVLQAIGAPVARMEDADVALRERRQQTWNSVLEPVVIVRANAPAHIEARVPERASTSRSRCSLTLEDGSVKEWSQDLDAAPTLHAEAVEGVRYLVKRLSLAMSLPMGYHEFSMELGGRVHHAKVLAAPDKSYKPLPGQEDRMWGVFLPLYALHNAKSWGGGDYSDLKDLVNWVAEIKGGIVGMLPLLATYLTEPFDPSPYAPASRLFWNELYININDAPELPRSEEAQRLLSSNEVPNEIRRLRTTEYVDYRPQMSLKRQVLEALSRSFFTSTSFERRHAFEGFVEKHPRVEDYARFRAAGELNGRSWLEWDARQRGGQLNPSDYSNDAMRYHVYAQWLAHEQMEAAADQAKQKSVRLYLDYPIGVHRLSYDVWRERSAFVEGMSAGAPPDHTYTKGQNWGFLPMHPEQSRGQGHSYLIECLRNHLGFGKILRLDHALSLHRLYWIPAGMEASEGVYVRNPTDELYAILKIEAHRHQSIIVGEDLGTIPRFVPQTMARHGIKGLYVLQQKLQPVPEEPLPEVSSQALASLNTHDMPPFASFLQFGDIVDRKDLGLLDDAGATETREERVQMLSALGKYLGSKGYDVDHNVDQQKILMACLAYLAASPAEMLLVNLEDLWGETRPQNVPSTFLERPNWRRKTRYPFETFRTLPQVVAALEEIARIRSTTPERAGVNRAATRTLAPSAAPRKN